MQIKERFLVQISVSRSSRENLPDPLSCYPKIQMQIKFHQAFFWHPIVDSDKEDKENNINSKLQIKFIFEVHINFDYSKWNDI